jgi:transposase
MTKKRTYRSVNVKSLVLSTLLERLLAPLVIVAIDIAKVHMAFALAGPDGETQQIVRFEHPQQTPLFLDLVEQLRNAGKQVEAVFEPTGTYGDALCTQLHQRNIPVYWVHPKKTHDLAEVYDGSPGTHDAKATTLIVRLHVQKVSRKWEPCSEWRRELKALVGCRDIYAEQQEPLVGKLEAQMARHFPELGTVLSVNSGSTVLKLLRAYPSPVEMAAAPAAVQELLRRESREQITQAVQEEVVMVAKHTQGVPMSAGEQQLTRELCEQLLRVKTEQARLDAQIRQTLESRTEGKALVSFVGSTTTAVILADLGDPASYASCGAFEKACGLNLVEKSSGNQKNIGIHISKRGPARVRKYLYLATLRYSQDDAVARAWYQRRGGYEESGKMRAVIALMRKQVQAIYHVAKGARYEAGQLFDLRKLAGALAKATPPRVPFVKKAIAAEGEAGM